MTVKEHLEKLFGTNTRLLAKNTNVQVCLWDNVASGTSSVVCTLGMSNRAQTGGKGYFCSSKEPRTELLSFCRTNDAAEFGRLLLDLSQYPFEKGYNIFWWQTIPLGFPMVKGSKLDGLFLSMPPFSADDVTFYVDDRRIDLVWVIPITASELLYFTKEGVEAFEKKLEQKRVDISDLYRESIC